jgi:hypothetical protein
LPDHFFSFFLSHSTFSWILFCFLIVSILFSIYLIYYLPPPPLYYTTHLVLLILSLSITTLTNNVFLVHEVLPAPSFLQRYGAVVVVL